MLGGADGFIYTLALFMSVDYVTGVLAAFKNRKLSSRVGFWGLVRKVCVLALVGMGHFIDLHIIGDGAAFRTAVIFFYLSNEGLSILENVGALGVPFPDKLKNALIKLREKDEEKEDKNGNNR